MAGWEYVGPAVPPSARETALREAAEAVFRAWEHCRDAKGVVIMTEALDALRRAVEVWRNGMRRKRSGLELGIDIGMTVVAFGLLAMATSCVWFVIVAGTRSLTSVSVLVSMGTVITGMLFTSICGVLTVWFDE